MHAIPKYAIIKQTNRDNETTFKIVHRSLIYIKTKNGMQKVKDMEDLENPDVLFSKINGTMEAVKILDTNDELDELRNRNRHISEKRIPLVKRQSLTPMKVRKGKPKNEELTSLRLEHQLQKKKKNSGQTDDIDGDHFYSGLNNLEDDGQRVEESDAENLPLPTDDRREDPSDRLDESSPLSTRNFSHVGSSRSSNDDNIQKNMHILKRKLNDNNKEIEQIKKNMVTKHILNESLNDAIGIAIDASKEKNTAEFKEPSFDDENRVRILDDFTMNFDNYYSAINATSNSRRAKIVMREFWPTEDKYEFVTKFNPKNLNSTVVSHADYTKLIRIMTELQSYKPITVHNQKDRISTNIVRWVGEWLKSLRYTKKNLNPS